MTVLTKDGISFLRAALPVVHKLSAAMAVNADHPLLLVDVRDELVIFNTIRPDKWFLGRIWRPVFRIEVMLKTAMIIGTDPVPVMTLQALFVAGSGKEGVSSRLAISKIQMAGRASSAVIDIRIAVTAGIEVTAQTAPAQQVVCQLQRGCRDVNNGYLGESAQWFLGAKGLADLIDLGGQGEVNGLRYPCHLGRVTSAADLSHGGRVGRLCDETCMGIFLIITGVLAGMAGRTGKVVGFVQMWRVAVFAPVLGGIESGVCFFRVWLPGLFRGRGSV